MAFALGWSASAQGAAPAGTALDRQAPPALALHSRSWHSSQGRPRAVPCGTIHKHPHPAAQPAQARQFFVSFSLFVYIRTYSIRRGSLPAFRFFTYASRKVLFRFESAWLLTTEASPVPR